MASVTNMSMDTNTTDTTDTYVTTVVEPVCAFNTHIEQFGLTRSTLCELMNDTGATLAGGAVTHYLSGSTDPLPHTSDLDFWVYLPTLENLENLNTGKMNTDNEKDEKAAKAAFTKCTIDLIVKRFLATLSPLGFMESHPIGEQCKEYIGLRETFRTAGENVLKIKWFHQVRENNAARTPIGDPTKWRKINLMFTSCTPLETIKRFDIPLTRALMYSAFSVFSPNTPPHVAKVYSHNLLTCTANSQIAKDFAEKKLSPPTESLSSAERTPLRVKKYCERYGLTVRGTATTCTCACHTVLK